MKKKNLLTLGALVLSLGLTVTSCAGAKGEDGAPGKDGTNGTNGKDGKDGADGKTYLAVINLDRIEGVKVKQSAYFIEPGESVTFTFEPKTSAGAKEIITDLELNGEVVEDVLEADEKGVVTWTWKSTAESKGAQLTGGLYTDADKLGETLVNNYLADLQDSDLLLVTKDDSENVTAGVDGTDWSDDDFIAEQLEAATTALKAVTDKWDDDTTVTTKVSEIKAAVAEIEKDIDEEYAELIKDAIVAAKAKVEALNDGIDSDGYLKADSEATISRIEAALDACTSLFEIAQIVNETEAAANTTLGTPAVGVGSFNTLVTNKKAAFSAIDSALNTVTGSETWMKSSSSSAYKKMVANLEALGVSVSALPSAVWKEYADQISAATSIEVYTSGSKKGQTVLGATGSEAIKESVSDIKDAIVEAVRSSYYAELDSSKVLTSSIVTNLKGVVDAALSDWVSLSSSATITSYLSTDAPTPCADQSAHSDSLIKENGVYYSAVGGLQGFVEACFTSNDTFYTAAFNAERLGNAASTALSAFKAQIDSIKTSDKVFATLNNGKLYDTDGTTLLGYVTVETLGDSTAPINVDDVYVNDGKVETKNKVKYAASSNWKNLTLTAGTVSAAGATTKDGSTSVVANVDIWYDTLANEMSSSNDNGLFKKSGTKVADIRAWQSLHVGDFKNIYSAMKTLYASAQYTATATVDTEATYITNTDVYVAYFAALGTSYDFAKVSSVAKSTKAASSLLTQLSNGIESEVEADTATGQLIDNDSRYVSWLSSHTITNEEADGNTYLTADKDKKVFLRGSDSELVNGFNDEIAAILGGSASKTDVEKWINNIDTLWQEDCKVRLETNLEIADTAYANAVTDLSSAGDQDTYRNFVANYKLLKSLAGHIVVVRQDYFAAYGFGVASVSDSLDLTDTTYTATSVTNATNSVAFTFTSSSRSYYAFDLRGLNFSSADFMFTLLEACINNAKTAGGVVSTVPTTIDSINVVSDGD